MGWQCLGEHLGEDLYFTLLHRGGVAGPFDAVRVLPESVMTKDDVADSDREVVIAGPAVD